MAEPGHSSPQALMGDLGVATRIVSVKDSGPLQLPAVSHKIAICKPSFFPMARDLKQMTREVKTQLKILGGLVVLLWAIELVNWVIFRGQLVEFGIFPRTLVGLRGIVFAPFLHAGFGHLLSNTLPLLGLGWLVMLRRTADFWAVSIITMLVSGLGVWLLGGANTLHVGASGVIFGYLGYLLMRGYFERSVLSIGFSLVVVMLYGGLLWGVFPTAIGISWQGHLFGLIGGGVAARDLTTK